MNSNKMVTDYIVLGSIGDKTGNNLKIVNE